MVSRILRLLKIVVLAAALVFAACGSLDGGPDVSPAVPPDASAAVPPDATVAVPSSGATQAPDNSAALPEDEAAVTAVSVGYGDAMIIQLSGQSFLVDTGAKKAGDKLLRALAARGVERLSGVFLTHPHSDHIGGLKALAQRYEIGMIYAPAIALDMGKTDKLAADVGVSLKRLSAVDKVAADSGAVFEVLGPLELNGENDNDNSLVLRLSAGGLTWLLTGDMQFAGETSLMRSGADLKADVLKVGNHGNPDATSDEFARAVSPSVAVISTSTEEDNDSANPRVISALRGADVYVTQDFSLGVLMTAKGGELEVADLEPPEADVSISLSIDKVSQTATLVSETDADLSGWFIWSEKGSELFVFPQGASIRAGVPLVVACRGGRGDYIWDDKKVWGDKADEAGVLYTSGGAEATRSN
jgi:competence protein ComEC